MTTRMAKTCLVAALFAGSTAPAAPNPDGEGNLSEHAIRYAEGFSATRAEDELRNGLVLEDFQSDSRAIISKPKGSVSSTLGESTGGEFWIYDAATELFYDDDGDGYYHYLRVIFDADTFFTDAYVYAELYLSWDGETWERYFVTEDFLIQGSTSLDEYEIETEFVTGYPTGLYDVLIELYDADFGDFVGEFGPLQSSDFSLLPIEDLEHDGLPPPPVAVSHEHGGSGSISWLWLMLLFAGLLGRRYKVEGDCSA